MTAAPLVLLCGVWLAWVNGGNDVSKGIATLVGAGLTDYRRAILWGALWTAVGGGVATLAATAMLQTFGQGLIVSGVTPTLSASLGALAGAAAWVLVATRASWPVSTTHALVGGIVGSAVVAYGVTGVAWASLGTKVVLPLLVSPLAAFVFARVAHGGLARSFRAGPAAADCVCVTAEPMMLVLPAAMAATLTAATTATPAMRWVTVVDHTAACQASRTVVAGVTVDRLHWLSSGAVSLARGMNDAPKIVALALATLALAPSAGSGGIAGLYGLVIAGMVVGSLVGGRRVTRVLAEKVTPLDHHDGLAANASTAALVTAGAVFGWPMSTTHVSTGGIVGVGSGRGSVDWRQVSIIGLAWVVTLPGAAALAAMAAWSLDRYVL
jgi:PiT family inorganic phosphate transporter